MPLGMGNDKTSEHVVKRDVKLYKGRFGGGHNILDWTGLAVPSVTAADFVALVVGRSNLHDLQVLLVVAIDTPGLQDPLVVFTDHKYHFDSLEGFTCWLRWLQSQKSTAVASEM